MRHDFPPALDGQTAAQVRRGVTIFPLTGALRHLIPSGRLPLTAGRVHFMRKVNPAGQINLLNERWLVGDKWSGHYVRATLHTRERSLAFWHQADAESDWHLIKTRRFRLEETVHALLPEFRRNRARCRDCLPG